VSLASLATVLHLATSAPIEQDQCTRTASDGTVSIVNCPTSNFLVPNGTIIFEWIVFILVLIFLARKVIPRITAMIDQRQATIQKQFDDAEAAKDRLEKAEQEYSEALAETRRESSRLREQAQAERAEIVEEARSEAQARVEEMLATAADRVATERQQAILALRNEIGELATTLAERIVHDSLRKDARQRQLVANFIAGVGATEIVEAEHAGHQVENS
jgi:F-type H+-transporting ATPase subunit b